MFKDGVTQRYCVFIEAGELFKFKFMQNAVEEKSRLRFTFISRLNHRFFFFLYYQKYNEPLLYIFAV